MYVYMYMYMHICMKIGRDCEDVRAQPLYAVTGTVNPPVLGLGMRYGIWDYGWG